MAAIARNGSILYCIVIPIFLTLDLISCCFKYSSYTHGLDIAPRLSSHLFNFHTPLCQMPRMSEYFRTIGAIPGPSKTRVMKNHSVFGELGQGDMMNYFGTEEKTLWTSEGPCTLQGAWWSIKLELHQ